MKLYLLHTSNPSSPSSLIDNLKEARKLRDQNNARDAKEFPEEHGEWIIVII